MRIGYATFHKAFVMACILLCCGIVIGEETETPLQLRALLITGQSNHNWQVSAPIIKTILEDTDIFLVDVATTPAAGEDMSEFMPQFAAYDVVVLKYTGDSWPESTQDAFVSYVANGGGVVVVHEANNAFPDWPEFNEIIGLGGWGGRDEEHGPYVYWRDDRVIYDPSPGPGGAHGRQHSFEIKHRQPEHPILRGLPEKWQHTMDELYHHLRGPARNMTVLATAFSDPDTGGSGEHEPVLFTVNYEDGRMFQTTLGHAGPSPEASVPHQCAGFIVTLQRGAEWAATGAVTQPVPDDFPEQNTIRIRPRFKKDSISVLMSEVTEYQFNDSLAPLVLLEELTRKRTGAEDSLDDLEAAYIALLQNEEATYDAKLFACKQLSVLGGRDAVPVLAEMLLDFDLAYMARYALERIPDRRALDALRDALPMVGPEHRAGIISSLAARQDRRSIPAISAAIHDRDDKVAATALRALATIGYADSASALLAAVDMKEGEMKELAEASYIKAGFTFLNQRRPQDANEVFTTAYDLFKDNPHRRGAALRGIIATASARDLDDIIIDTLRGDDTDMQLVAATAARDISRRTTLRAIAEVLPELEERPQIFLLTALAETDVDRVTPHILETAESENEAVRIAALQALASIGEADATLFLLEHATTASGRERAVARHSLSRLPGADRLLLDALQDMEMPFRSEVLHAIAARNLADATPILLEQLPETSPDERMALLDILTQIADPEQLDMILPLLLSADTQDSGDEMAGIIATVADRAEPGVTRIESLAAALEKETEPAARRNIYVALGKIGDETALELLEGGLEEEDASVRLAAMEALSVWPTDAPLAILDDAMTQFQGTDVGTTALTGFIRLAGMDEARDPQETAEMYERAYSIADRTEDKKACIVAIGATGNDASLPLLYEALASEEIEVARAALRALSAWPNSVPMARLEMFAKDGQESLRPEALRGYFRLIGVCEDISEEEATKRYREALELAHSNAERRRILSGLGDVKSLGALQVVAEYLDDESLQREAEVASVKLAEALAMSYPQDIRIILDAISETTQTGFVRDKAAEIKASLGPEDGYITAWEVAGPYMLDDDDLEALFNTPFAPEDDEDSDDVTWRRVPVGTNDAMPFLVELDKAIGGYFRVAYLRTNIWSDAERDAILEIGSDDGNKVWLNDELVSEKHAQRGVAPAQEVVEATLQEGWNTLLVKVTQARGEWSACVRILGTDNAPIDTVFAAVYVD